MNKFIPKIIIIVLICICFLALYYRIRPITPKVIIHGKTFYLEVAATNDEKEKGLGYRESLEQNRGMVFPYDRKDYFPFWMKGMNFPLDFLWIDGNIIVDITKSVPVMTGNTISAVRPSKPVDKIIEFNSGFAQSNGIQIGDAVIFKN
jgi:uncharacterized protein